jgi:hypothetical protein
MTTMPLDGLIARILRIPAHYRAYDTDETMARRRYGFPAADLDRLISSGLPQRDGLTSGADLRFLSLYLRTRSFDRRAMQGWLTAMATVAEGGGHYRVDVRVRCPEPGHAGACRYELLGEDGRYADVADTQPVGSYACSTAPRVAPIPDDIRDLTDRYDDVLFYPLPFEAGSDDVMINEYRMADCLLMARTVVAAASARGIQARTAFGLVLSLPFAARHMWVEFRVGDAWVPFDPYMARCLHVWGLTPIEGPSHDERLVSGIYARIGGEYTEFVRHDGAGCDVTYAVTRVDRADDERPPGVLRRLDPDVTGPYRTPTRS